MKKPYILEKLILKNANFISQKNPSTKRKQIREVYKIMK